MKIIADLHAHTPPEVTARGAALIMAAQGREAGLRALALTDHAPATRNKYCSFLFDNDTLGATGSVKLLKGAEADIIDYEGSLGFGADVFGACDIVLAALHTYKLSPADALTHTRCFINALSNPLVDILAHTGDNPFDFDERAVVLAAKEHGKALEFNELSLRDETCIDKNLRLLALCRETGCDIVVSSDAQTVEQVGAFSKVKALLKKADIPETIVINSSVDNLNAFFARRGKQVCIL